MKIIKSLNEIPSHLPCPIGLTLGSFDGVHLGHQILLKHLRSLVSKEGTTAALTFSNHPSKILSSNPQTLPLSTIEHKLLLLEKADLDLVILLNFNTELSQLTYEVFLKKIKRYLPFSFFVLGKGAAFGKEKKGDELRVKQLGSTLGFCAEYLDKLQIDNEPISSGRIRKAIEIGNLANIQKLLGRPYSIYRRFEAYADRPGKGKISCQDLCLLPKGVYSIKINHQGKSYFGTAEIFHSPPYINISLENSKEKFSELDVEVEFLSLL